MASSTGENIKADGWRVVVVTNIGGALIYHALNQILPALGHRIVGVVTSPGPQRRRSTGYLDVVAAVEPNVDVLVSNHPSRWAAIAPLRPDLIICGGMPWRLPGELINLPRLGAINMHPALLPRHHGPSPFEWVFRLGDAETGLTIHRMAADFDAGPILAQGRVPVDDDDDFHSMVEKFGPLVPRLMTEALARVARGDPGEPQDESRATYAGLPDASWQPIDWRQPARTIHNQIRSLSILREPCGGVGAIDGRPARVTKTRLLPPARLRSAARRRRPRDPVRRRPARHPRLDRHGRGNLIDRWGAVAP
jgi:methionyl-tRNA formyltransferase